MGAYIRKFLERKKREENRAFRISTTGCYFCDAKETVHYNEHWYFCVKCSALYTFMLILETKCKHIKPGVPLVTNNCWFPKYRKAKAYIGYHRGHKCSICGKECYADGW